MADVNLYQFIKEEKQCKWNGCRFNHLGFCECMNDMFLNDIIVKSSDLLSLQNPEKITYECRMATPKVNHCLCGKEIDCCSVDGFEHAFGVYKYKVCDCGS